MFNLTATAQMGGTATQNNPRLAGNLASLCLPCLPDAEIRTKQSSENANCGTKETNQGTDNAADKTNHLCCAHTLPFILCFVAVFHAA